MHTWKTLTLGLAGIALILGGCGSDDGDNPTAPTGPGDTGPTPSSYEIELSRVDDGATVAINGEQITYLQFGAATYRENIDQYLDQRNNTLEVVLGNGGCGATSLRLRIFEDGVEVAERDFALDVSHCGYQLRWRYTINREAGITRVE